MKYGLDHATLCAAHPGLVYCSISGYGQTGPNREKPGYDLMAQGFGGIMSLTGEAQGAPSKVGVGIADVMCGMYATVGILAALRHRERTGEGQHIDIALVDAQLAWLINEGTNYLASDRDPIRRGNGHPNIVPYDVVQVSPERSQKVMQERKRLEESVGDDERLRRMTEDLDTMFELGREGEDVAADLARDIAVFRQIVDKLETLGRRRKACRWRHP